MSPSTVSENINMNSRVTAREGFVALMLALLAVSIAWIIAAFYGAVGIPRNDDWVYYRAAFQFADTHSFEPESSSASLIGLVLLAYPIIRIVGHSIIALQLLVAALGGIGLWSTYMLVRGFLSRWLAVIAVMILALGPIFGSLAVSFMTDVPAFTLQIVTLLLGVHTLRRTGPLMIWWFGLALAVGLLAFSIREYALAAGASVSILVLRKCWVEDRHTLKRAVALTAAWVAMVVALYLWRQSLPNAYHVGALLQSPRHVLRLAWIALETMSILVAPSLLFLAPKRVVERLIKVPLALWLVPLFTTCVAVLLTRGRGGAFLGNYFSSSVPYAGATRGIAPRVIPMFWTDVLQHASQVGVAILMILLGVWLYGRWTGRADVRASRGDQPLAIVSTFLSVSIFGFLAVLTLTRSFFFDRYLLPTTPLLAALLLHAMSVLGWVSSYSWRVGVVSLALFGVLGGFYVDLAAAFDGGKWRFNSELVALGFKARSIDGGYEWFGIHQPDAWAPRPKEAGESWWVAQFSRRPVCVWVRFEGGADLAQGEVVVARREIQGMAGKVAVLEAITRIEPPEECALPR